jgi:hypothetical protein
MRKKFLLEKIIELENQNLKIISYLDYLAYNLDRSIQYVEYVATECDKHIDDFKNVKRRIETYIDHDPSYKNYLNKKDFFDIDDNF